MRRMHYGPISNVFSSLLRAFLFFFSPFIYYLFFYLVHSILYPRSLCSVAFTHYCCSKKGEMCNHGLIWITMLHCIAMHISLFYSSVVFFFFFLVFLQKIRHETAFEYKVLFSFYCDMPFTFYFKNTICNCLVQHKNSTRRHSTASIFSFSFTLTYIYVKRVMMRTNEPQWNSTHNKTQNEKPNYYYE